MSECSWIERMVSTFIGGNMKRIAWVIAFLVVLLLATAVGFFEAILTSLVVTILVVTVKEGWAAYKYRKLMAHYREQEVFCTWCRKTSPKGTVKTGYNHCRDLPIWRCPSCQAVNVLKQ